MTKIFIEPVLQFLDNPAQRERVMNVLSQLFKRGRTVVTNLTSMLLMKREGRGGRFVTCQYVCHKPTPSTLSLITNYRTFVSRVRSSFSTGEYHRSD